ncbi:MAG TPA: hypothetical protein ENJ79_06090 [Gammaproteobacteria bacterium]|nr:hypothetical protein [Gammaproteobacteria bacterium]
MHSPAGRILFPGVLLLFLLMPVNNGQAYVAVENQAAETQAIPYRKDSVIQPATLVRVLGVALAAIALAAGIIVWLRKYLYASGFQARGGPGITLLEARRLSPRLSLFLVEVDARRFLISQSGESVVVLSLDASTPSAQPEAGHAGG